MLPVSPSNSSSASASTDQTGISQKKGFSYWLRSAPSLLSLPNITSVCLKAFDSLQKIVECSLNPIKTLKNWVFIKFSKEKIVPPSTPTSSVSLPVPFTPEQTPTPDSPTPEWLLNESPDNTTPPRLNEERLPRTPSVNKALLAGAKQLRKACKPITDDNQVKPSITKKQIELEDKENDLQINPANLPRPALIDLTHTKNQLRKVSQQINHTPKEKEQDPKLALFNSGMLKQHTPPDFAGSPESWNDSPIPFFQEN